jgi:hypothetical protein
MDSPNEAAAAEIKSSVVAVEKVSWTDFLLCAYRFHALASKNLRVLLS